MTGLTLSTEQLEFARKRIADQGLSDQVSFKLQDYRDETARYDGIASIEMFEAVGQKYWPVYFQKVRECLEPGRSATLQIITVNHERWELYRKGVDFIQKYIFPGGMLQSLLCYAERSRRRGLMLSNQLNLAPAIRRHFVDGMMILTTSGTSGTAWV